MSQQGTSCEVGRELIAGWLAARSIARGLPLPVPDKSALRVNTGSADEVRRYVFAGPTPEIRELAQSITAPHVFIKMGGHADQLLDLVPPRWELQPGGYLMTHAGSSDAQRALPAGYRMELFTENLTRVARIFAADGGLAASGYAAEYGGVFIFDRILTEDAHQRRGLGRAVMAALGSTQSSDVARRLLVATGAGRALYSTLGWIVLSPFSTVVIQR